MAKSRVEDILLYALGRESTLPSHLSRVEKLLIELIQSGGSGGGIEVDSEFSETSENPVQNRVITDELNMLKGDGEGSIRRMITLIIAELLAEAPESFNTLQEIAMWIATHADDAASMNRQIQENTDRLNNIDLSEYVRFTDYGGNGKAGTVSSSSSYGSYIHTDGVMRIIRATEDEIREGSSLFKPIVPGTISVMMSSYGIETKTTIPEMQERITTIEQTIGNINSILEEVL